MQDDSQIVAPYCAHHRINGRLQHIWRCYREWAIQNEIPLQLLDETVGRLLYWAPCNDREQASRWREVLWGCLQLHRLAFDIATTHPTELDNNSYGTSVSAGSHSFPAKELRVAITVLQSLSPVAQELVRDRTNTKRTMLRQALVRLWIERVRFLLRLSLLGSYWRRVKFSPIGVLLNGGIFHPVQAPTADQEAARLERRNYVGRRTGRRLGDHERKISRRLGGEEEHFWNCRFNKMPMILGELLYILRPIVTADADSRGLNVVSKKAWLLTLAMDLLSLQCMRHASIEGNSLTKTELRRRRMRLLLYLLRAPIWEQKTRPALDWLDSSLHRVPLFGTLISNYIWECVYFWRIYGAEEG